jgi:hypothetical protein
MPAFSRSRNVIEKCSGGMTTYILQPKIGLVENPLAKIPSRRNRGVLESAHACSDSRIGF